jgi:hypothetical protein
LIASCLVPTVPSSTPHGSARSILDAMTEKYETSGSYEDEGTVSLTSVPDNEPDKRWTSRVKFSTMFDRSTGAFRFDQREEYEGFAQGQRVAGTTQAAVWRTGPGQAQLWSSNDQRAVTLAVEGATAELAWAGEASFRVPMLLFQKKNLFLGPTPFMRGPHDRARLPTLEDFTFRVEAEEKVRGNPCVKVTLVEGDFVLAFWIGTKDHAIWRVYERFHRQAMLPGQRSYQVAHLAPDLTEDERKRRLELINAQHGRAYEVTVDYTPRFDVELKPARFAFVPPETKALSDRCAKRTAVADGSDPLVDDVEDGDIFIRIRDHRVGRWWVWGDDSCVISPAFPHADSPGGRNTSRYAMHIGAHDCGAYGFGLGFALNDVAGRCAYDAHAYDGVYFWGRSGKDAVSARFKVGTRQTQPMNFGGDGTCGSEPGMACWDQPSAGIDLTRDWQQYAFRWSDLKQSGWGRQIEFDPTQITSLIVSTTTIPADFREIWIDQVGFFKGQPPPSPYAASSEPH